MTTHQFTPIVNGPDLQDDTRVDALPAAFPSTYEGESLSNLDQGRNRMRTHGIVGLVVACALSASANASECALTMGTETIELPHVFAVARANMFDDTQEDWVDVYCFRDEVPAEKQSASEIKGSWIWARTDNASIVITVSAEGDVRMVEVRTDQVEGLVSDARSYAEFDGAREPGGKLRGSIKTTKDMAMSNLGVENVSWRVSATLDVEVMSE